jgi:hypothetical protein
MPLKQNPTEFDWTPASANTDATLPFVAGEVTGFVIGIRPVAGSPGVYPITIAVNDPAATKETLSAAVAAGLAVLKDGTYQSAIKSVGPVDSAWTSEVASDTTVSGTDFAIVTPPPPVPVPLPPSGFSPQ